MLTGPKRHGIVSCQYSYKNHEGCGGDQVPSIDYQRHRVWDWDRGRHFHAMVTYIFSQWPSLYWLEWRPLPRDAQRDAPLLGRGDHKALPIYMETNQGSRGPYHFVHTTGHQQDLHKEQRPVVSEASQYNEGQANSELCLRSLPLPVGYENDKSTHHTGHDISCLGSTQWSRYDQRVDLLRHRLWLWVSQLSGDWYDWLQECWCRCKCA